MDSEHFCLKEQDWGKLWEILKTHSVHVIEGDKSGGFRDRLLKMEIEVSDLKKSRWITTIVGGIIGGLVGAGSKDVLTTLLNWIMKL